MEKKKVVRIPYEGVRTYKNFTVAYSMKGLLFSFEYAKGEKIEWTVDKDRVTSYPNFQKMSERDLYTYYTYTILPQMTMYFNVMLWYY
jgi:hypothetical protein